MKSAKTVPEQVNSIKHMFKCSDSLNEQTLQFLCDLYFISPLKHPVRNQILKFLITGARLGTGNLDETLIVNCLVNALRQLVDESKIYTESIKWNATIVSVTGCFENFKCGLKALEQCLDIIFPFACASINKYITELGVLNSPSVRNEYYIYVHNSIRFLLSSVQEFGSILKSLDIEHLKHLKMNCKEIIADKEIPMDPRKNAGILLAHLAKLLNHFEQFLANAKDTKNPHEIVLAVGIINTCDQEDFHKYSADIRDICGKIEEIANMNATIPNILLCATRALHQISKLSLTFALKSPNTLDDVKLILRKLLIFTVAFMEHHIDSVRHLCRDILRNIVAAARKVHFDFLLQKIYDACNSDRLSLSVKCVVLQQVAAILGTEEIIINCLRLFSEIFDTSLGRDLFVNNLYESLMLAHHKETTFDNWVEIWINYLLKIAELQDQRLPDIEILIVKAVKCEPRIVQIIINGNNDNEGSHSTDSGSPGANASASSNHIDEKNHNRINETMKIPISTKLSVLWAVRKSGIKCENFPQIMQKFSKHLQLCVLSNCDETRIMALRLLVETHKTTEALTLLECKHIITFLEYNVSSQNTANRQKSFTLLSKALTRCELNLVKLLKGKQPTKLIQNQPLEMKFLQDLMRILVENLFTGANFSRRSLSLQLLEQCLRIGVNCNLKLLQYLPKNTVENLLNILDDSYEWNKELAVGMLKLLQDTSDCNLLESHNLNLNLNLENIQNHLKSLRPKDSVTAAYQLDFLCHKANADMFGVFELPQYEEVLYAVLKWLIIDVKMGLKQAKQNILDAAKFNPLYGLLFAIRRLLKNLDYNSLALEISWRILIAELICLCKELTSVVAPIVNNSSPEGHIPNDFSDVPNNIIKENANSEQKDTRNENNENDKSSTEQLENDMEKERQKSPCKILSLKKSEINLEMVKTTSQMVLLCAWRTVKEVSLILGEIISNSPIQLNKLTECFVLTKEQILEMGEHFKQLLIEIKHRGAFEQVYVGFSKLCCRLWTIECLDLNVLPMLWLKELINFLHKDEQQTTYHEKLMYNNNTTRRSAGIPFMVQALVTAELKLGTTKSLHYCISHLFMLCGGTCNKYCIDSQTHALNILRALFRCTDLSEAIGEFIADGIIVAINSYDNDNWSIKNSATLLFSALIIRIFGVQRNRDTDVLSIRNKMTGRIFFLRYPKLYDYLLEELQLATKLVEQHQKARKLYPLLLLMSRLYPSALEGTESNLKLSSFIPFISQCESCPEMRTRQLAAKAIVALINKDDVPTIILTKCAEITLMSVGKFNEMLLNKLHGNLIQILYLIKHYKTILNAELIGDITATIVSFHECTGLNNLVILKVMLDIFNEILNSLYNVNLAYNIIEQLLHFVNLEVLKNHRLENYEILYKSYIIYNLHIELISYKNHHINNDVNDTSDKNAENDDHIESSVIILDSPLMLELPQQHINTLLSIILLILIREHLLISYGSFAPINTIEMEDNIDIHQLLEECDIDDMELEFVKALDKTVLKRLASQFKKSTTIYNIVKSFIKPSTINIENGLDSTDTKTTMNTSTIKNELTDSTSMTTSNRSYTDHIAIAKMRSYAIISILENFDLSLMQLLKSSKNHIEEITLPIMLCVERAISLQAREYKCAYICLQYLLTVVQPWQTDCVRLKAACILSLIAMHYPKALEKKRLNFVRPYSYLILTLLMDEVTEVRDFTSKIVLNSLPDDIELESIVPTMAQRLFLQHTADILLQRRLDDNYIINVFKSIVTSLCETSKLNANNTDNKSDNNTTINTNMKNNINNNNNSNSNNNDNINIRSSFTGSTNASSGAIPKSNRQTTTTTTTLNIYDQHDDDNYSTSSGTSCNFSSSSTTTFTSSCNDVEIFERNEQNVYAEPQKTINDTVIVFKTTFRTRFKVLRYIENFGDEIPSNQIDLVNSTFSNR